MQIYSWNINGFRAVLKKGFMDFLEQADPDVLCLQEIRCTYEEVDLGVRRELESAYDICWFPSTVKKGYAGSATLSKKELQISHQKGLGIDDFDQEGRMIESRFQSHVLLAGYFPNASTGLARLPYKRAFAKALQEKVAAYHREGLQVIVAGDMNVAPEPIDLARPKDNEQNPGFTLEEREDFNGYLQVGLLDWLRLKNPDVPGLYTWWTQRGAARAKNVGWRIDHFLVSQTLMDQVKNIEIHAHVMGSDHCPVSLTLLES